MDRLAGMTRSPAVYESRHRVHFSDLDPYRHMRTARYSAYFVDHRMDALREQAGWDLVTLENLPFMTFVKRLEIEFLRPVIGDQEIVLRSFVREFAGSEAHIECTLADVAGRVAARCLMVVAYVDKATRRSAAWPEEVMALFDERAR